MDDVPHTSLELISQSEIIVIGGDSYSYPSTNADAVISGTVSRVYPRV